MVPKLKTANMTREDSRQRAGTAREHLQVAEERYEYAKRDIAPSSNAQVSASNSILAGIAAADAITGVTLGVRANDSEHNAAVALVGTVLPDGKTLGAKLNRLLSDKTLLQYGGYCTTPKALEMLKLARALVESMDQIHNLG